MCDEDVTVVHLLDFCSIQTCHLYSVTGKINFVADNSKVLFLDLIPIPISYHVHFFQILFQIAIAKVLSEVSIPLNLCHVSHQESCPMLICERIFLCVIDQQE